MYTIIGVIATVIVIGMAVFTLFLERGGSNSKDDSEKNKSDQ